MATFEHYAVVIPNNHLLVSFVHEQVNVPDQLICTIGLDCNDATPAEADLDLVGDAWRDNVMTPIMSDDQTLVRVNFANAAGVVYSQDRADVGGSTSAFSPCSNALIVEKRTGVAGRRNRGRLYLPAVEEAQVDAAGRIASGHRAGVDTDFAAFLADVEAIAGGTYELVILHSKGWDGNTEPADPGNAPAPTRITSFYCRPIIGTQRRRLR